MHSPTMPSEYQPFVWQYLESRVRDYLFDEGLPAGEAGRLAREIIAMCANEAETMPREAVGERAFNEAQTLLQSWRAARCERLVGHA
jgi:hypothetical protein